MVAVDVHREAMTLFESKTISNLLWKRQAASSPQRRFRTLCPDFVRHKSVAASMVTQRRGCRPSPAGTRGLAVRRMLARLQCA